MKTYRQVPNVYEYLSGAQTGNRLSRDAYAAKWLAANKYGIGTEIRRATLICPFVNQGVPLNEGRKQLPSGIITQMPSRAGPGQTLGPAVPSAARKAGRATQTGKA